MEEDNEDIQFEEILFQPQNPQRVIVTKEKEYSSLYEELEDRCNPSNFLHPNPYNKEKAEIANTICLQLQNAQNNIAQQKHLRHTAIILLGIRFNSHALRDKLKNYTDPNKYKGTGKFSLANDLYSKILDNGDDVESLEKIQLRIEIELLNQTIEEKEEIEAKETKIKKEIKAKKRKKEEEKRAKQDMMILIALVMIMISIIVIIVISDNK
jgi:hypothetical protein